MADTSCDMPLRFRGYDLGKELGRGAFGRVYACLGPVSKSAGVSRTGSAEEGGLRQRQCFAAKAIDLRRLRLSTNPCREKKKLFREASILRRMPPHPNLVRFVQLVQVGMWLFFVLELVEGGNLFAALVRRPGRRSRFREGEARYVFAQLVCGLGFLHSKGVIHRDLKLENVLVRREREEKREMLLDVKIADFGLSKAVGDGLSEANTTVGSPRYMAPEVINRGPHDCRADLWSLGVLVFVLLSGRFPCDGGFSASVRQSDLDCAVGNLPVSGEAQSAVVALLQVDPLRRETLQELREHEWLVESSAMAAADAAEAAAAEAGALEVPAALASPTKKRKLGKVALALARRPHKRPRVQAPVAVEEDPATPLRGKSSQAPFLTAASPEAAAAVAAWERKRRVSAVMPAAPTPPRKAAVTPKMIQRRVSRRWSAPAALANRGSFQSPKRRSGRPVQ
eukprot:TRINITY_DN33828_c0_g1_i1.p1 TRINITY_DN33828_c0_g1~~TRINITY_DN33828_c0_g1_i1.p1  ORF type:complete len:483 (-),score=87.16 TRINITY_DN33828_c0_g1_i1:220-1578(-)